MYFVSLKKIIEYNIYALIFFILLLKPVSLICYWFLVIIGFYIVVRRKIIINKKLILFSFLFVFYFATLLMSTILSPFDYSSLKGLFRILSILFAPFVGASVVFIKVDLKKIVKCFKIATITASFVAIVQLLINGHFGRYSGMYNANTYGDIMAMITIFSIVNIAQENKKDRILSIFSLIFGLTGIVLSGSRGSLFTFIIVFIIFAILSFILNKKFRRYMITLSVMVGLIFALAMQVDYVKNRIQLIKTQVADWEKGYGKTSSIGLRLEMYSSGFEAFKKRPVFGYGYHYCIDASSKYASQDIKVQNALKKAWHLHNELLTTMVNGGIISLFSLLLLFIVPFVLFCKGLRENNIYKIGIILLLGYMIIGIFHTSFGYEYETVLFIIVLALSMLTTIRNGYESK
jgi:O-antigen ligase